MDSEGHCPFHAASTATNNRMRRSTLTPILFVLAALLCCSVSAEDIRRGRSFGTKLYLSSLSRQPVVCAGSLWQLATVVCCSPNCHLSMDLLTSCTHVIDSSSVVVIYFHRTMCDGSLPASSTQQPAFKVARHVADFQSNHCQ
jgi:hypothetical protein